MQKNKHELSDEQLMILYQTSDFEAFELLYQRHSRRVLAYFHKRAPLETAKDLLQETFTKLHLSRDKYDPRYPFLPWLFTISRNTLFDFFKQAETRLANVASSAPALLDSLIATPAIQAASEDTSIFLSGLPHNQKRAVELRYLHDWSFEKIATDLKTSEDNVRQLVSRGIKKIRLTMNRKRGEENES